PPQTVLVVGPPQLAEALEAAATGPAAFEIERTFDNTAAIDLARALAPDIILVDADRPGARELVEAFGADALTEQVPIVVAGRFAKPDDAAPFVALGVAKALVKPVSPDALRRACREAAVANARREIARAPLGDLSLDELGTRL